MKEVPIYQTLEERGNYSEVINHGPYFCSLKDPSGFLKGGVREPWAGEGYYFWDSLIDDAHWWGKTIYGESNYIICQTTYDQHSELLLDTVCYIKLLDELFNCAVFLKEEKHYDKLTLPLLLTYLRTIKSFKYKAIRIHPVLKKETNVDVISMPGRRYYLPRKQKVQICFFDKTLLPNPFEIVYSCTLPNNFTI